MALPQTVPLTQWPYMRKMRSQLVMKNNAMLKIWQQKRKENTNSPRKSSITSRKRNTKRSGRGTNRNSGITASKKETSSINLEIRSEMLIDVSIWDYVRVDCNMWIISTNKIDWVFGRGFDWRNGCRFDWGFNWRYRI